MRRTRRRSSLIALGCVFAVLLALYLYTDRSAGRGGRFGGQEGAVAWRLDPVPLMTVGDTEADPLFEVTGIAITDMHVVIAQESEGTLRFYDRTGTLEETVGGRGEGPGEYGSLDWMRRVGDHLFAYDRSGRRILRYGLDGRLLGTVALSPPEEYLPGFSALGVFADGSVLAEKWYLHWPTEPEVARASAALLLFDDEGAFAQRLLEKAGPEVWYEPVGTTGMRQMMRFFGRVSQVVVVDSVFAVLENDSYDIPVYGRDGAVQDTLRPALMPEPTPLPQAQAEFARQSLLDFHSTDMGSTRGVVENMLAAQGFPAYLPPYGRLSLARPHHPPVAAADGLVWALRYGGIPREGAEEPDGTEWYVFQPGNGQIATLTSPDVVILVDVAGDLAAVVRHTELNEEIVELRRIVGR